MIKQIKMQALKQFATNHGLSLNHILDANGDPMPLRPRDQDEVDTLFAELLMKEYCKPFSEVREIK